MNEGCLCALARLATPAKRVSPKVLIYEGERMGKGGIGLAHLDEAIRGRCGRLQSGSIRGPAQENASGELSNH